MVPSSGETQYVRLVSKLASGRLSVAWLTCDVSASGRKRDLGEVDLAELLDGSGAGAAAGVGSAALLRHAVGCSPLSCARRTLLF